MGVWKETEKHMNVLISLVALATINDDESQVALQTALGISRMLGLVDQDKELKTLMNFAQDNNSVV